MYLLQVKDYTEVTEEEKYLLLYMEVDNDHMEMTCSLKKENERLRVKVNEQANLIEQQNCSKVEHNLSISHSVGASAATILVASALSLDSSTISTNIWNASLDTLLRIVPPQATFMRAFFSSPQSDPKALDQVMIQDLVMWAFRQHLLEPPPIVIEGFSSAHDILSAFNYFPRVCIPSVSSSIP